MECAIKSYTIILYILYMLYRKPPRTLHRVPYEIPHIAYIYIYIHTYIHTYTLYEISCYRTSFRSSHSRKTQRFGAAKFSQTTPFGTFEAIEPPLVVVRICKGYQIGSVAPVSLKQALRKMVLSSRCLEVWKAQRLR